MQENRQPEDLKEEMTTESGYSVELRNALEDERLQELLQGETGCFSIRYAFINEYINYINQLESNSNYKPVINPPKSLDFSRLTTLIKKILTGKSGKPIDVLFISRNRQVKVRVKSGYLTGDYIFYMVIDELKRRYPHCRLKMHVLDDSYTKYYYATPQDFARSVFIAMQRFVKWTFYKGGVLERLKGSNCKHVISVASYFFHPRIFLRDALMGYSTGNMLNIYRPKVIISNDDCVYTKPLDNDAKMVVQQSARMVDYLEECKGVIFQDQSLKPELFLSSGRTFGDLKERSQAAQRVMVTGLPRYDVLGKASEIYSRPDFLKRYDIDPGNKIVQWSTQCHVLGDEENAANFQAVFGAIRDLQGVTLVIKRHPAEEGKYAEIMRGYIVDYKIDAVITPKDSDTSEQLFVCDLMITKNSTTAMEAVALNKPVIILNLSGDPDPVEYVREGVALGIYAGDDLKGGIKRLLDDDRELALNRPRYIENYLYKVDGMATDRVVTVISELLKEKGSSIDDARHG